MKLNNLTFSETISNIKRKVLITITVITTLLIFLLLFISNNLISIPILIITMCFFIFVFLNKLKGLDKYSEEIQQGKIIQSGLSELADSLEKSINKGYFENLSSASKNEDITSIANTYNYIIDNIGDFINKLDDISEETFTSSRNLSEVATSTESSMKQVNNTLLELTSTTQELTSSISDISDGANDVNGLARDGLQQLKSMDEQMSQIIITAKQAGERIKDFKSSSDEINDILSVIKNIADQTNLLALNAAIEAARAGEHGRGFNVVADEIRQLSQDTQESLEAVSKIVDNIGIETTKTVEIINSNNIKIESGEEILEKTSGKFEVIAKKIENMVAKIEEVASGSQEITAGSEEISSLTEEQTLAAAEFTGLAKGLAEMAVDLKNTLANTNMGAMKLDIDLEEFDSEIQSISTNDQKKVKQELGLSNKFIVSMIARLEPIKGHKFFIESMEGLLRKNDEFLCLLIGDGSLEEELREMLAKKGLSDKILLLGYREDISLILSISDLVVLTSEKEGMPPSILLEAMAAKKAIVASDVTGSRNLVNNNQNGLLVEYNDIDKLQESVQYFLKNPQKCEEYGKASRRYLEELLG